MYLCMYICLVVIRIVAIPCCCLSSVQLLMWHFTSLIAWEATTANHTVMFGDQETVKGCCCCFVLFCCVVKEKPTV